MEPMKLMFLWPAKYWGGVAFAPPPLSVKRVGAPLAFGTYSVGAEDMKGDVSTMAVKTFNNLSKLSHHKGVPDGLPAGLSAGSNS